MDKKERSLVLNIVWKPFFAAMMTAVLSVKTELPPLLIGAALGIAASVACYLDLRRYRGEKDGTAQRQP